MGSNFLGGMGLAYQGAVQGVQAGINRENDAEDREYARSQRRFQDGQLQRALDEQGRKDTLRKDLAAVKPAGTPMPVVPVASSGLDPTKAARPQQVRTQDQELRDIADLFHKAGDIERAMKLRAEADRIGFGRATAQFNQVMAGANDSTPIVDVARRLGSIYDADPASGGIKGIEPITSGMHDGVRVTIHDKNSGQESTRSFVGPEGRKQLIDEFHAYYSPDGWAKIQASLADAKAKIMEKGVQTVPDGYVETQSDGSHRFVRTRAGAAGAAGGPGASQAQAPTSNVSQIDFAAEFDIKNAQSEARKQVAQEVENGSPMTPGQQAQRVNDIIEQQRDDWVLRAQRRYVTQQASAALRAASGDPAIYAQTYAKLTQAGMSAKVLDALGFKPPQSAAAAGGSAPAPSAGAAGGNGPVATPAAPTRDVDLAGVRGLSDSTPKQIAGVQGHTSQKAAADELARRADARADANSGVGYGFGFGA